MEKLQEQNIPLIIFLGSLAMLLLIGGIGLLIFIHQKRMLKEKQKRALQELHHQNSMIKVQLESQEQERKRIGADLHDSLGSILWGIKINASFIQRSVAMNDTISASCQELNQLLDEGMETVRRIAWELTPEAFQHTGLSASVNKLCERLSGKGIEISFTEENKIFWNDDRALQAFRIVQELINNAFKHSGATALTVSMKWSEKELKIIVSDNGKGFNSEQNQNGIGLWSINQRTKQLNGKICIGETPMNKGTKVLIEIPLML